MKTKFFSRAILMLLFLGALAACQGPEGPQGPQGPPGPQGPQGPQGPAGNANVISSEWITPNWQSGSFYGWSCYYEDWQVDALNQDVYDNGVVIVYWKNYRNQVFKLPFEIENRDYFTYVYELNKIKVLYYNLDGHSVSRPPASNKFRYVIIPQGTGSRPANAAEVEQMLARRGVDINNYYQVCAYFGLEP